MLQKSKSELQSMELAGLSTELEATCKEYFELSLKHKAGSLKQTHQVRLVRRQIARLNTLIQLKRSS